MDEGNTQAEAPAEKVVTDETGAVVNPVVDDPTPADETPKVSEETPVVDAA